MRNHRIKEYKMKRKQINEATWARLNVCIWQIPPGRWTDCWEPSSPASISCFSTAMLSCSFWFVDGMAARKRPPCLAAQSAVLSLAPSLFSQTFCLSCLLGVVSEMRSWGFVTRTVCSMLEVKSVLPICFNFVKRSK